MKTVAYLESRGHTVIHMLDVFDESPPELHSQEHQIFLAKLKGVDLVIADYSSVSPDVVHAISFAFSHLKQVVALSLEGSEKNHEGLDGILNLYGDQVLIQTYSDETLTRELDNALLYMKDRVDKRFHIILPASLMDKLDKIAKQLRVPKAAYIRQLLEAQLLQKPEYI